MHAKPFISVKLPVKDSGPEILICPSQDERPGFAEALGEKRSILGELKFLEALRLVLVNEVYDAAFSFFDWLQLPATASVVKFGEETSAQFEFDFCGVRPEPGLRRAEELENLFNALDQSTGNDFTRRRFMEALAFTFSRYYGLIGKYETALSYVERAMGFGDGYLHLEACQHALDLKRRGFPVPDRLSKFVGYDAGNLMDHICEEPFTRFEVNPTGEVHVCCPMWVPSSIGNIERGEIDEIWNGEQAQKIRKSILDGSYKYCSHVGCPAMLGDKLLKKDSPEVLADPVMSRAVQDSKLDVGHLKFLKFGYDESCNLSCPSCRREVMIERGDNRASKEKAVAEKFIPLLPSLKRLRLNSGGEFLVSRHSRRLLQLIDWKQNPDLKIDIVSNGTLFSRREWDKFANIHPLVRFIRISTDAATPQTFELVRRGGRWPVFRQNLDFIAQLRRENSIEQFVLAFTYQDYNFREMRQFVELCRDLGADKAIFNRIYKTSAMTEAEFAARAVHCFTHPLYRHFIETANDPIFASEDVATDFDYPVEQSVGANEMSPAGEFALS